MIKNDSNQQVGAISFPDTDIDERCEIRIKGHLDEHWSDYLGNLEILHDCQGNTKLCGIVKDQAALHGILAQIRDLGLSLISVMILDSDPQCDNADAREVQKLQSHDSDLV